MTANVRPLPRAVGESRVVLQCTDGRTRLKTLYQQGCAKVRFPHGDPGAAHESVLINTAGGLTDGDQLTQDIQWLPGAQAIVTTQAAERVYRSRADDAVVRTRLSVGSEARAVWLPQETIMFEGGRLARTLDVDVASDAGLFAAESVVFGRTAMGETVRTGSLNDAWRITRQGKPLFADRFCVDDRRDGDLSAWRAQPVTMHSGIAMLTAVLVTSEHSEYQSAIHDALQLCDVQGGVSDIGAALVMRAVSHDAGQLRNTLQSVFYAIQSVNAAHNPLTDVVMPRAYFC